VHRGVCRCCAPHTARHANAAAACADARVVRVGLLWAHYARPPRVHGGPADD
jgi:hypothetical protein